MEWQGRVAVVTGANSGIGFGITERLLEMGLTVVGLDKDLNNIEGINKNLHPYKIDLAEEKEITKAFQYIDEKYGRIDVLVNNAGFLGKTTLLDGVFEEWRRLFAVNVLAVGQCTVEAVKIIRKREIPFANIINITSLGARNISPIPEYHFYCATKFAARAMIEGFRLELTSNKLPIRMSSIEPGLVKSRIYQSNLGDVAHEETYKKGDFIEPRDVAYIVHYLLNLPQHVNVPNSIVQHLEAPY